MSGKRGTPINRRDILSDLPDNVIDIILSRMPLEDAVQTSILSTKWRNNWRRIESLRLDQRFFNQVLYRVRKVRMLATAYISIVGNVLLSHSGPIREFYLHVPDFGIADLIKDAIYVWVSSVSRRGVQDITLEYEYYDPDLDKFPLSVFQCVELKQLSLKFVNLDFPPTNFRRLSSLVSLNLTCDPVSVDMLTNIFLNCPLLERFWLDMIGTIVEDGPFVLAAHNLKLLSVTCNRYLDFILKDTPNITTLSLSFKEVRGATHKCQDILDFFDAVSKVENVNLESSVLWKWGKQHVPEKLPVLLEKHLSLSVCSLYISSLPIISAMFCLIKSSPNLHTLEISMKDLPKLPQGTTEYLQSHIKGTENLWNPRIVKVKGFTGKGRGILLIQVILSCCPMLEKLYLKTRYEISPEAEFQITSDIMRFHRASTEAEIILRL